MSAPPVPAPRSFPQGKKPVPVPRTTIPIAMPLIIDTSNENDGKTNTFGRKVRDIGEKVTEGRKAVIATTRQSVRKLTKRLTNSFTETDSSEGSINENEALNVEHFTVFDAITFDSPIRLTQNIEEDDVDIPPPPYPPPPLPNETYDVIPPSLASSSTASSDDQMRKHVDYESVFPSYPYNSDSESCVDMTAGTIDRNVRMDRSTSWNFYDSSPTKQEEEEEEKIHTPNEPTYNNVDNTPTLSTTSGTSVSFSRANSLYENWEMAERGSSSTKSILMEFDPLTRTGAPRLSQGQELIELEKLLQGDLNDNFTIDLHFDIDNLSLLDDVSEADGSYISPPAPPERFDSLETSPEEMVLAQARQKPKELKESPSESKSNWYVETPTATSPTTVSVTEMKEKDNGRLSKLGPKSEKYLKRLSEFLNKAPELVKGHFVKKENGVPRPMIQSKASVHQKGMLFKIMDDLFGELHGRWCDLQPGLFVCYSDSIGENVKESIPVESILSVQIITDQKFKYKHEDDELFCFEVNIAGKIRAGYVYGTKSKSERRIWMRNLAESMCDTFGPKITSEFNRIGWTYMKTGLNGRWRGAWLCLVRRKLHFIDDNATVKTLDLRKARCFKVEPFDEATSPSTTDKGPNIVIHFTSDTYYFRMWTQRETKVWCHIVTLAARDNGPNLNHQQLTKHDVPVIVEKCINFVYVHGSMAEGIYRRAGSNATVTELTNHFRSDAWSVQLTDKYTAHDVASVLKRFFRDLAEPLIDSTKRQYLYQVTLVKNEDERVRMYKGMFDQLHKINYNTTRKLLGHLYFISTMCGQNLMTVNNLASVWGPTLLQGNTDEVSKDRAIIAQLIELCKYIFPEDPSEREKDQKMLSILKKYSSSPQGAVNIKSSGDFRVWIYLYHKNGDTFNMLVGPKKTAQEIITELCGKVNMSAHELLLEELVLNDQLRRPLHYTEKVLDVVMRWSFWDEADRKDNCLILNKVGEYREYINAFNLPLSAELKFADHRTKTLKTFNFDFHQAKLTYFKDKQSIVLLGTWNIEDIFVYFGSEAKRIAQHVITFFPRNEYPKRNKTRPYFGHVLSFPDAAVKATWIATMWHAEHQSNLLMPVQHVNII